MINHLIRISAELECVRTPPGANGSKAAKNQLPRRSPGLFAGHAPLDAAPEPATLPGLPQDVQGLLAGLSGLQQEILGLRFVDGLSLNEIAEILKIPLGTVKSRLHHALSALRKKTAEE